ncbi:MAG: hybrid sensor histidine kinase/response regulator [Elusimicrobiota bacterium]
MTSERLKVLVVDDEAVLCTGVRRILEPLKIEVKDAGVEATFEVKTVGNGAECLKALEADRPDVLVLDYKLPDMTGLDILHRATPAQKDILVIMATAYASLETAVRATKLGAYDFLAKPFTPDELRYALRKATTHVVLSRKARVLEAEKRKIRFEFISVLSHELKAPLNAVEGYMEILKERTKGDELFMVERSLTRLSGMKKLIYDLLDMTRIESGHKKRDLKTVDLAEVVKNAMEAVEREAQGRGIVLHLDAGPGTALIADASELEIVANNLVSNAVKYNRDGGRVDIVLKRSGDALTFSVRDTGIGLSPEDAAKLFKEFTRIRNEHTARILGSGLGLSTVRKLARMYGGDATVESRPGEGSTFTVILKDAPAESTAETAARGDAHGASTRH